MTTEPEREETTIRDRFRAQVRDEVKRLALAQIAAAGPQGLSINAIAKQLGVSGPALYRYFAGRDALLTELVVDAYRDLAAALTDAATGAADRPAGERFAALVRAYRAWALDQPHRYRLLFGPPLPGYDAHEARLVDAAQAAMDVLLAVLPELGPRSAAPRPRALARQLARWAARRGVDVAPADSLRAVLTWARLHGLVSLEIGGNFASMEIDAEALFEAELAALVG